MEVSVFDYSHNESSTTISQQIRSNNYKSDATAKDLDEKSLRGTWGE